MFKSIIKIAAATVVVVGIHSLLASKAAKKKAGELFGERTRNGLYRPLYNGLAIITFGALGLYGLRLPNRELYKICGSLRWLMHSVQLFFVLYMLRAGREVGFLEFAGVPNVVALAAGQSFVPIEPEGQGPILESPNQMKITGPFRLSRHPLNFGMLPIIWLMPRMTVNLAAFNVITTVYLILGSIHEEKRFVETYGQAYVDYQKSPINFFVPSLTHSIRTNHKIAG
jgi:protein-S-isoprenylcysteine O-methyltransferase Ste14